LQLNVGTAGTIFIALAASLVGAMVGSLWTNPQSMVRLSGRDAEYFFMDSRGPDALRIELSDSLRAVASARRAQD
jgi:hypothetical protein